MRAIITILFSVISSLPALSDSYDPYNYRPIVDTTKIDHTNLPILFIDTRGADSLTQPIHKDWRIAARMKII